MPASFVVENGAVTIRFDWLNVATAKAQEIVSNAALYDWRRGLGPTIEIEGEEVQKPWEDLTNQEKLTMCFQAATRLIIAQAKSAYINEQQGAARDTATEYAESEYCLE